MESATDSTKLERLARFSVRFRLLKRLAETEEPVLSSTAAFLLKDKLARQAGLIFELAFTVLLPALFLLAAFWMHLETKVLPFSVYSRKGDVLQVAYLPHLLGQIATVIKMCAYAVGIYPLVWPVAVLMGRDASGNLLRYASVKPLEVFRSLVRLQFASFVFWPLFVYPFDFLYTLTAYHVGTGPYPDFQMRIIVNVTLSVPWAVISLVFFAFVAIFSGMALGHRRAAFAGFLGIGFIYYSLACWVTGYGGSLKGLFLKSDILTPAKMNAAVFAVAILGVAVAGSLAYVATMKRVMPAK